MCLQDAMNVLFKITENNGSIEVMLRPPALTSMSGKDCTELMLVEALYQMVKRGILVKMPVSAERNGSIVFRRSHIDDYIQSYSDEPCQPERAATE